MGLKGSSIIKEQEYGPPWMTALDDIHQINMLY
jgi:hypothetical protein